MSRCPDDDKQDNDIDEDDAENDDDEDDDDDNDADDDDDDDDEDEDDDDDHSDELILGRILGSSYTIDLTSYNKVSRPARRFLDPVPGTRGKRSSETVPRPTLGRRRSGERSK